MVDAKVLGELLATAEMPEEERAGWVSAIPYMAEDKLALLQQLLETLRHDIAEVELDHLDQAKKMLDEGKAEKLEEEIKASM